MNYPESLQYLNQFLNFEKISYQPSIRLWNLKRMEILLDWFGHPEKIFLPVIIAGTKGKGSTGYFLESILSEAGVRTGYYNSPHLEEPTERIRLGGRMISKSLWISGLTDIQKELKKRKLPTGLGEFTYFEIMTLLAIRVFAQEKIQAGIFEVGMGGRLDATNVLKAPLVILTPISMDHEAALGNTIAKIAFEKAAVIHAGANVVTSLQPGQALQVIKRQIHKTHSTLWKAPLERDPLGLAGDFQRINAGLAVKAAQLFGRLYGISIPQKAIAQGLSHSDWMGRLEKLLNKPECLLDAAHNPASIEALVKHLQKNYPKRQALAVFACAKDKKSRRLLEILSGYFQDIILTAFSNSRACEVGSLMMQARGLFQNIFPAAAASDAYQLIRKNAKDRTLVVVTGSFYLLGEFKKLARRDYA